MPDRSRYAFLAGARPQNALISFQGHSFSYDFTTYDQPGTYWYHSHLSTQYCDGLRGAIVVYDLLDPYRWMYDVDNGRINPLPFLASILTSLVITLLAGTVITLADWYHTVAPELVIGYDLSPLRSPLLADLRSPASPTRR